MLCHPHPLTETPQPPLPGSTRSPWIPCRHPHSAFNTLYSTLCTLHFTLYASSPPVTQQSLKGGPQNCRCLVVETIILFLLFGRYLLPLGKLDSNNLKGHGRCNKDCSNFSMAYVGNKKVNILKPF